MTSMMRLNLATGIEIVKFLVIALSVLSLTAGSVFAEVSLPSVINSHMVLQRDMPLPIWGWAEAGEKVSVSLAGNTQTATTGDDGKWSVTLPAMKANAEPRTLTVSGSNKITLEDVLVGEVWVGSGQSNMEWQLQRSADPAEAIAAAQHPNIRLFHVKKVQKKEPANDVEVTAHWNACTPKTIPAFSAVLYYFGRDLHEELDIPIGLINSSWGGSPIEPWTVTAEGSGGMYNGMIAPLQPFAVRGAIWYQGETNVIKKNGLAYFDRMKALIEGWRKTWNQDLPFYFVQIAPWSGARYEAGQLPALWEAQVQTLKLPRTGIAVTTDLVDNIADIHPRNKKDVGDRLSRWALTKTYGKEGITYSGPLYKSMTVEGNAIRLKFAHADGLKSRDGEALSEFQVAGDDGKFVAATANVDGSTVVVSSPEVGEPRQVRFGWHKLANPNLVNGAGLPASPFQTDNWRGGTGE